MLMRRWERARQGEPGLGKSRPIEEFRASLSDTPHTWTCERLNGRQDDKNKRG